MTEAKTKLCAATKKDGTRCRVPAHRPSVFCQWHDPKKAEKARRARSLGGYHSHRRFGGLDVSVPTNEGEVRSVRARVTTALLRGEIPKQIAEVALRSLDSLEQSFLQAKIAEKQKAEERSVEELLEHRSKLPSLTATKPAESQPTNTAADEFAVIFP